MRHQLIKYEGVPQTDDEIQKETVVGESTDLDALYAERDALDASPTSLTRVRHGVRPATEKAMVARA